MGNFKRFKRLSYIVSTAWFYKLKDMNSRTMTTTSTAVSNSSSTASTLPSAHVPAQSRKSYHFYRDIVDPDPDPPRMSSKHSLTPNRSSKPKAPSKHAAPSPFLKPPASNSSATFGCGVYAHGACPDYSIFDSSSPEFRLDRVLTPELRGSCGSSNKIDPAIADDRDVVIYMDENSIVTKPKRPVLRQNNNPDSNPDLPRIITKPKHGYGDQDSTKPSKKVRENIGGSRRSISKRYSLSTSPRLRLKINSPRLGSSSRRPSQARKTGLECSSSSPSGRRKLSGSFAIVKSSFDPKRDFRESMVEMIVEHNIKASKDLEELLACYLSLNSGEYHELIIDVFKQIWFDLTDIDSQLE